MQNSAPMSTTTTDPRDVIATVLNYVYSDNKSWREISDHFQGALTASGLSIVPVASGDVGELVAKARDALDAAHKACFNHPDRGPVGMSHGPFSGVNFALGVLATAGEANKALLTRAEAAEAANAELRAAVDEAKVRVKPLTWNERNGTHRGHAPYMLGYTVSHYNGFFFAEGVPGAFDTVDEAKAACETDYERRILSALSVDEAKGDGWEASAKRLEGRDKFIVDRGLWSDFVATLPLHPAPAVDEKQGEGR
jgi:hypothetical protein